MKVKPENNLLSLSDFLNKKCSPSFRKLEFLNAFPLGVILSSRDFKKTIGHAIECLRGLDYTYCEK